jgi:hypothetical protein
MLADPINGLGISASADALHPLLTATIFSSRTMTTASFTGEQPRLSIDVAPTMAIVRPEAG